MNTQSTYMQWAKKRPKATYDLALSGILNLPFPELEATIDERGFVTGARVLRSVPLLDAAALAALKQWRYTPTLLNGIPVRVLMTVTFRFSLADPPMLAGGNSGRPAPAWSRRSAADRSGAQSDRDL